MKLATYVDAGTAISRIGVQYLAAGVEHLIDAARACAACPETAALAIPIDMISLLAMGETGMSAVRAGVQHANSLLHQGAAAKLMAEGILVLRSAVRLLAPIPRPGKILAIGANYAKHVQEVRETGVLPRLPPYPPAFLKMSTATVGSDQPIVYPDFGEELDYEVELAMVVGRRCRNVDASQWLDYVAGFTIVNDLSMRDVILQEQDTGIVLSGKNFATSCPMGPYITTKDEIRTPDDLRIQLRVNGESRQSDRTSSMIHSCGDVFAYWSRLGFEPGDVITTGTPGGVAGFHRRFPERLLKPGDVVEAEIEGVGVLRNPVIPATGAHELQ